NEAGPRNPDRLYNPNLPLVAYRANQAESDYFALTARTTARMRPLYLQLAYTWGHVIDNQSDPLAGDYFDLDFTRLRPSVDRPTASFSRQFDQAADRGSADFDQRHNMVLSFVLESPLRGEDFPARILRHWMVSGLAAFRSGFPYSVLAAST